MYEYQFHAIQLDRPNNTAGWLIYRSDGSLVGYAPLSNPYTAHDLALKRVTQQLWMLDEVRATAPAPSAEYAHGSTYGCQTGDTLVRLTLMCILEVTAKETRTAKQHHTQFITAHSQFLTL